MADRTSPAAPSTPVLIVGGGPVGLTLSALLARQGIASLVVEARAGYAEGSRAICVSRRSMEILGWTGADDAVARKGLPWTDGRSFYRDTEVLHFSMPHRDGDRFAPMINIQQYYFEQYVHEATRRTGGLSVVRWDTEALALRQTAEAVELDVRSADGGIETLSARYLVACDGGRSRIREQLGLKLEGMQYDGRYVIVDIEQKTTRPTERLAWFDPPSNRGSTLLMHRQPDDVWRIDYQVADDEDPVEAIKPGTVLPRVQSHLTMIGEHAPWKPLWISIYNAKCLTLDQYRHGRVFFAGDAAHLVPIFGVRGLNSGVDDAANLAWKLAFVLRGQAGDALLDTYTPERRGAALENMAYGAKSTEFMAPPSFAFDLMREATLRLALSDPQVRSLINPRQSAPVRYAASPAGGRGDGDGTWPANADAARPGSPAPDARIIGEQGESYLSTLFGSRFTALRFMSQPVASLAVVPAETDVHASDVQHLVVLPAGHSAARGTVVDADGSAWARYGAVDGATYLVRPDGYVLARWAKPDDADVPAVLSAWLGARRHPSEATLEPLAT